MPCHTPSLQCTCTFLPLHVFVMVLYPLILSTNDPRSSSWPSPSASIARCVARTRSRTSISTESPSSLHPCPSIVIGHREPRTAISSTSASTAIEDNGLIPGSWRSNVGNEAFRTPTLEHIQKTDGLSIKLELGPRGRIQRRQILLRLHSFSSLLGIGTNNNTTFHQRQRRPVKSQHP